MKNQYRHWWNGVCLAATGESQTQDTAGEMGTTAQSENADQKQQTDGDSGNTAEADATGGELFELQPVDAYTTEDLNYNDPESRVCKEHDDPDLQDVKLAEVTPGDFSDAEVVFIGYPVWWGIAAWPVNEFVKENDFTGKTVIPFCTSASSGRLLFWLPAMNDKNKKCRKPLTYKNPRHLLIAGDERIELHVHP